MIDLLVRVLNTERQAPSTVRENNSKQDDKNTLTDSEIFTSKEPTANDSVINWNKNERQIVQLEKDEINSFRDAIWTKPFNQKLGIETDSSIKDNSNLDKDHSYKKINTAKDNIIHFDKNKSLFNNEQIVPSNNKNFSPNELTQNLEKTKFSSALTTLEKQIILTEQASSTVRPLSSQPILFEKKEDRLPHKTKESIEQINLIQSTIVNNRIEDPYRHTNEQQSMSPTTVQVNIGHLEIRSNTKQNAKPINQYSKANPVSNKISLKQYLQKRRGGTS